MNLAMVFLMMGQGGKGGGGIQFIFLGLLILAFIIFLKGKWRIIASCGFIGAIFGFIASQYFPLFGGIATFGTPFSKARLSLISGHAFLFLAIGIMIGFFYTKDKFSNK